MPSKKSFASGIAIDQSSRKSFSRSRSLSRTFLLSSSPMLLAPEAAAASVFPNCIWAQCFCAACLRSRRLSRSFWSSGKASNSFSDKCNEIGSFSSPEAETDLRPVVTLLDLVRRRLVAGALSPPRSSHLRHPCLPFGLPPTGKLEIEIKMDGPAYFADGSALLFGWIWFLFWLGLVDFLAESN